MKLMERKAESRAAINRLYKLAWEQGLTDRRMSELLHVDDSTIAAWRTEMTLPSMNMIERIHRLISTYGKSV